MLNVKAAKICAPTQIKVWNIWSRPDTPERLFHPTGWLWQVFDIDADHAHLDDRRVSVFSPAPPSDEAGMQAIPGADRDRAIAEVVRNEFIIWRWPALVF